MAEANPTQEELILRRRARRRLVGAVALALLAVVILPMVFDPEPRPLGDKVEIRIPDQAEPFVPTPAAQPVEPVPPVAEVAPAEPATPAEAPPGPVKPVTGPEAKPEAKVPAKAEAKPEPKPAAKPEMKSEPKPAGKSETKVETKPQPAPKPEAKPKTGEAKPTPDKPAAGGDYYLQLGVFSSKENAEQQAAKAKAAGFKAGIVPSDGKFRVRIGPVGDRAKALDYQAKLKSKGLASVLVEP